MTKMQKLEHDIRTAHENGVKYLLLGIQCYKAKEIIMINRDDFIDKLEYCKRAYNDDLVMSSNSNIKIMTYMFSDNVIIEQLDISKA